MPILVSMRFVLQLRATRNRQNGGICSILQWPHIQVFQIGFHAMQRRKDLAKKSTGRAKKN